MCSKILLIFCKYERTIEDVWAVSIWLTVEDFHVHYMFFTDIVHIFSLGWYLPSLLPIPDEEMDTSWSEYTSLLHHYSMALQSIFSKGWGKFTVECGFEIYIFSFLTIWFILPDHLSWWKVEVYYSILFNKVQEQEIQIA